MSEKIGKAPANQEQEHPQPQRRIGRRLGRLLSRRESSTSESSTSKETGTIGGSEHCLSWRDALVEEACREEGGSDILLRRPDRISVTLNRPSADAPLGFRLARNEATGRIHIAGKLSRILVGEGGEEHSSPSMIVECNPSALVPGSRHSLTFFEPGDVLDAIDATACRNLQIGDIQRYLCEHVGRTTLSVTAPNKDEGQSHLCQAIVMKEAETEPATTNLGITFGQKQGLLRIQKLAPNGWFGPNTAIHEDDLVVAVNQSPCITLSPEEAQTLLNGEASGSTCLSVTTIAATDAERRWSRVRKAAVAVGGGTMVGVGAIMMVTPLHPVGHAMAIGGVGVLGTKFDGPKRAAESARSRLRRGSSAVSADGADVTTAEEDTKSSVTTGEEDNASRVDVKTTETTEIQL